VPAKRSNVAGCGFSARIVVTDDRHPRRAIDKPPPADLAAERAILADVLTYGDDSPVAVWSLTPADFYDPRHAEAWSAILRARLYWEPTTIAAVPDRLLTYLAGTAMQPALGPHATAAAVAHIRRHAATRRAADAAHRLLADLYAGDLDDARHSLATLTASMEAVDA